MSAETEDSAGTPQLRQFHMVSIKEFPRGINSDRVISGASATASVQRAPGPGLKLGEMDIASSKLQAPSFKLSNQPVQASSDKPQAPSSKHQATSHKQQAP